MDRKKRTVYALITLCALFLASCGIGPSCSYERGREQGLYPYPSEFPDTQWVCRELDIRLNMFLYETVLTTGTYKTEDCCYRVVADIWMGTFDIQFYSTTNISASKLSDTTVQCEPVSCGFIKTLYSYDKDTDTIICSVRNYDMVDQKSIPQSLTFERVGNIAKNPVRRWYSPEIDMYLDAFSDADGYFKGEMTWNGEKCYVNAIETGNNNYYSLSIETNKMKPGISEMMAFMINMVFEISDDQIIAKVDDRYISSPLDFSNWPYGDKIIVFRPIDV